MWEHRTCVMQWSGICTTPIPIWLGAWLTALMGKLPPAPKTAARSLDLPQSPALGSSAR